MVALGQWILKADDDLNVAEYIVASGYYSATGFHCQQSAEKYLKAYLVWNDREFPKTHDLELLLDLVEAVDRELTAPLRDIIVLTVYSVEVRYPGDIPEMSSDDVNKAMSLARMVKEAVMEKLPKVCPQCGHVFNGNGWDGIDAHWRAKNLGHENIMSYEEAWPLIQAGKYKRRGDKK